MDTATDALSLSSLAALRMTEEFKRTRSQPCQLMVCPTAFSHHYHASGYLKPA